MWGDDKNILLLRKSAKLTHITISKGFTSFTISPDIANTKLNVFVHAYLGSLFIVQGLLYFLLDEIGLGLLDSRYSSIKFLQTVK